MKGLCIAAVAAAALAASAGAATVQVQIVGEVTGKSSNAGFLNSALGGVQVGSTATYTFTVDSANFATNGSGNTRGYVINPASVSLTMGSVSTGMPSPYPFGQTGYFNLTNGDPVSDRFALSESPEFPSSVYTDAAGVLDTYFANAFYASYDGSALSSTDILTALGTYDVMSGVSGYDWTINDGPAPRIFIDYSRLTISLVPAPTAAATLIPGLLLCARRRRA